MPADEGIGAALPRIEDLRFVRGLGQYTDDIAAELPHAAFLHVVRSPVAAARILSIDVTAARCLPGVLAVLTPDDLVAAGIGPLPIRAKRERADGSPSLATAYYPLAIGHVRCIGDAVVAIVAETLDVARDAAEAVRIDYDVRDAVCDAEDAIKPGAPKVWEAFPDNVCFDVALGDRAATDRLFAEAAYVVSERIVISRVATTSIEPRAALGSFDRRTGRYTLHAGMQAPHAMRRELAAVLGLSPRDIRVIAPDVGGAFGMKGSLHPELVLVLWASKTVGRPVRFFAERSEGFVSDHQSRDMISDVSLALDASGRFLALRSETIANLGAYVASDGLHSSVNNLGGLAGVYTTEAFHVQVRGVLTNTLPTCPYRGAGRPEASYCIETIIDTAARRLGIDRSELRRRNMIPASAMPYRTPLTFTYDCGAFEEVMDECLVAADWAGFPARRAEALERHRLRGIGLACVIEVAGGPNSRPLEEFAEIRFDPGGEVTVFAGTHSQGQGHETAYRQLAVDALGVRASQVSVVFGDTDLVSRGNGTFGSRSMMAFGRALAHASEKIIARAQRIAAYRFDVGADEIVFEQGYFRVTGTNRGMSLNEVAALSFNRESLPPGMEVGLHASSNIAVEKPTFPNGCHVCEVEIDPATGERWIVSYHVVDDVGTVINPLLMKGQIHGGIAQGAGQILDEALHYDDAGQLITGSLMDYGLPRASDLPFMHVRSHPVPTLTNPLGVKGAGEAGAVGALPAVMSAIRDALAPIGVERIDMPATPFKIWSAIRQAGGRHGGGPMIG